MKYIWTVGERLIRRKILAIISKLKQLQKESLKKNLGLNGIRTHDLCDAGAVLYQLSYQANWELVILSGHLIGCDKKSEIVRHF